MNNLRKWILFIVLSLLPVASHGTSISLNRDYLFWDTMREQAVRKGKWKLLITKKTPNARLQSTDTPKGEFLFNLEADPSETNNLITQHPETTQELKQALNAWRAELSD